MKTQRFIGLTSLTVLTAAFVPAKTESIDFRSRRMSEKIVLQKSSPAYAALEDARINYRNLNIADTSAPHELLLTKIILDKSDVNNMRQLSGVVITKADAPAGVTLAALDKSPMTPSQPKVDHLAELVGKYSGEIEPLTMSAMGELLVQEELQRRNLESVDSEVRKIETQSGQDIIVAKPVRIVAGANLKSNANQVVASDLLPYYDKNNRDIVLPDRTDRERKIARYVISGPVNLKGGAAILGTRDELSTEHRVDGLVYSQGHINTKDAYYQIEVESLEGELVGEARNSDGQIIASGRINLLDIDKKYGHEARIKNVPLELKPAFGGSKASVISAASYGSKAFTVANAKLFIAGLEREVAKNKESGFFEDKGVAPPSTYLLKAQQENFWPSLALSQSGEEAQVRLFPKALVEALLSLTLDKYKAREAAGMGIIWGRISAGGRPLEGAKVHLVGEQGAAPIYFTGFIPDKTKSATSTKGEFAFTRIEGGESLIQVQVANQYFWPTLVPVEKGHVTYADLSIDTKRTVEFKSYRAFDHTPVGTALQPMGTEFAMYIPDSGVSRLELSTVNGLTLIETVQDENSPYVPIRSALRAHQVEVHFPQIETQWIEEIKNEQNIATNSTSTITVGFINGDDFEVVVGAGALEGIAKILYFDEKGKISKRGVAGGGYIIFNLPSGLQSLTILPEKSKQVVTHSIYVDTLAAHVTKINLNL